MRIYLLESEARPLHPSLEAALGEEKAPFEKLVLPANHEDVYDLFKGREFGVVYIPAAWEDLFSVKVLQEIRRAPGPMETVIVGPLPAVPDIVTAFNEGLSSYLEVPVRPERLRLSLSRARNRLRDRIAHLETAARLVQYEGGATPYLFSPQVVERDQMLATAFMNVINSEHPIVTKEVNVLVVTTSTAQYNRLETFLKKVGLRVANAGSMAEAVNAVVGRKFNLVISDHLLPDGDAVTLVVRLRKVIKADMPRVIVWSSSPEKAVELLKPETHIDDVIIKPGPGASIEHILPSLISNIYQTI